MRGRWYFIENTVHSTWLIIAESYILTLGGGDLVFAADCLCSAMECITDMQKNQVADRDRVTHIYTTVNWASLYVGPRLGNLV